MEFPASPVRRKISPKHVDLLVNHPKTQVLLLFLFFFSLTNFPNSAQNCILAAKQSLKEKDSELLFIEMEVGVNAR